MRDLTEVLWDTMCKQIVNMNLLYTCLSDK